MPADQEWTGELTSERPLPAEADELRPSTAEALKRLLRLENERLRMRQGLGLGGAEIAAARSDLVDLVVARACREAAAGADRGAQRELGQCAVIALGGYGRRELCPFSDVDLLFLHPEGPSPAVAAFVERALITLWDAGLTVGHSFRSIKECVAAARDDLHSRTALTEARRVVGNADLHDALQLRVETVLVRGRGALDGFLAQMRVEWQDRLDRFGHTACVLEPNVKEGPGGLRDLHAVLWVAFARHGSRGLASLQSTGLIEPAEYAALRRAHDFLLRLRNEAHFATGRKTDLITLDLQDDLATRLGYAPRGGLLASELLMRDYYRRASKLHDICRSFLEAHLEPKARRFRFLPSLRDMRRRTSRGFEVKDGALHLRRGTTLRGTLPVLEAFAVAQAEGVPLSRDLFLGLRDRASVLEGGLRSSPEVSASFLRLFETRGRVGVALRAMHETGVLARLLPEWGRITFLVQHDFFHKYTVDEHTLKAIDALDALAAGQDPSLAPLAGVFDEIADSRPLYLGMLLHDIAKGRGGGHVPKGVVLSRRILERLGVDEETLEKVVFLVGAHLEMSQTSQQRDLTEAPLIEAFASRMGSVENLNLLMLLTYADHCGVGPGIWNGWKASLLFDLYQRTRRTLEASRGHDQEDAAAWARERAVTDLMRYFPPEEVEAHLARLPERYVHAADAARLSSHFRLVRSRGVRPVAFEWADRGDGQGTELTVTAQDRPGLFAALAGTLTVHGIDILGADLFSTTDGVVLDTLRIAEVPGHHPVRPERRLRLEAALVEAVSGALDVEEAFHKWRAQSRRPRRARGRAAKPPKVRFDQEASALATVVEVRAQDQPGLAYSLARALSELGLDIISARIATAKALALDVFYVRDQGGRKLGPEATAAVEESLFGLLGPRAGKRSNG
jgi:[protein-PII] uridylyltransferase